MVLSYKPAYFEIDPTDATCISEPELDFLIQQPQRSFTFFFGVFTNLDHFTHLITNLDHFSYPTHTIYNTVTLLVNTERIIKLGSPRFSLATALQKWIKLITKVDHGMTP